MCMSYAELGEFLAGLTPEQLRLEATLRVRHDGTDVLATLAPPRTFNDLRAEAEADKHPDWPAYFYAQGHDEIYCSTSTEIRDGTPALVYDEDDC